jgi:hypothetical protein
MDAASEAAGPRSPSAAVADGRLLVTAAAPGTLGGYPLAPTSFRDVILDAVVALEAGDSSDAYGLFLRQVAERSYLAFTVTPDARSSVFVVEDGVARPLAEGPLPEDAPFARGLGAENRLTVIAAGPALTCLVNGFVLTGVIVEPRFKAGLVGALLVHLGPAPVARLAVRWAQVRALLADQEHSGGGGGDRRT